MQRAALSRKESGWILPTDRKNNIKTVVYSIYLPTVVSHFSGVPCESAKGGVSKFYSIGVFAPFFSAWSRCFFCEHAGTSERRRGREGAKNHDRESERTRRRRWSGERVQPLGARSFSRLLAVLAAASPRSLLVVRVLCLVCDGVTVRRASVIPPGRARSCAGGDPQTVPERTLLRS